jgi:hypothetical protein
MSGTALGFPRGSRCGWASLAPASSYDLQLSHERSGLPVRRSLVLSCCSGWWRLYGGAKPPSLDVWWSVDCLGTYVTESYMK